MTGFVVVDPEQRLLGLLTARDMLAGEDDQRVDELMTPRERLVTGEPGIELEDARRLLTANRVEKLPLVDGDDRVTGLVTLRDLSLADRYPRATRDGLGRLRVAAAIGIRGDYLVRAEALIAAEVDALVLDIAHGHADAAIEAVQELKGAWPDVEVVAGNIATGDGVVDLAAAGADAVKVGIGPGFACTTRLVAGVGVPQLTAVLDCAGAAREAGVPLIADGGIRRAGHVATAMGAGASTVMVGSLFAGREESPGDVVRRSGQLFKVYRGMASRSAAAARLAIEGRGDALDQYVAEGEEMEFPLRGSVAEIVEELHGGLRSGMSYVDAATIPEYWEKASFIRQTEAGERESHPGTRMTTLYRERRHRDDGRRRQRARGRLAARRRRRRSRPSARGAEPDAETRVDLERRRRHARPRQHAPPPLPDPHARPGAGGRPLHVAARAVPGVVADRRRGGVRRGAHRPRRARALGLHDRVRPPLRVPARAARG